MVHIGRLQRRRRITLRQAAKRRRRRRLAPMGRLQTGHAPALLIDQYGCIRPADTLAQALHQGANLIGCIAVAAKEYEPQRIRALEQRPLVWCE